MKHAANTLPLEGVQLVEASAGTGKTFTIASLFVRLLLLRELDVSEILVVTYTRAATAELLDRIRRRLVDANAAWNKDAQPDDAVLAELWASRTPSQRDADRKRLRLALADYDRAAIHTIHGFCQRVLQDHAFESHSALKPELITTERPLLQEVVDDFWAKHTYDAERFLLDAVSPSTLRKSLLKLAFATVHQRQAQIIPARAANASTQTPASAETLVKAKRAFADAWRVHGETTIETVATWRGLNRTKYNENSVRSWPGVIAEYLTGAKVEAPDAIRKLTAAALDDGKKKNEIPPTLAISTLAAELVDAANALMTVVETWKLNLRLDLIDETRAQLDSRKREHERMAFDDLLRQLRDCLAGDAGKALARSLRKAFPVALVDEFQDTDPVQYATFRHIYDGDDACALYLIGDPKQAIYRFRGADVFAYMDAVNAVRQGRGQQQRLKENFRSDPAMIAATNAVFTLRADPFVYDTIGFEPAVAAPSATNRLSGPAPFCAAMTILRLASADGSPLARTEAEQLASEQTARHIGHTLTSGLCIDGRAVQPRDIAVLCRTNKQAEAVQEALRAIRIPTARDGDSSVFDTPTATELERILAAVAQPDDANQLRVALCTTIVGVDATELLKLADEHDAVAWEAWVTCARQWHELWLRRGFMPMLQRLLADVGAHARLLSLVDGERRLTDLMHLAELLQRESSEHHTGPLSLVQWLRVLQTDEDARADLVGEETQIRLESDAHAVKLTTVHRSKGLEYPIVYCPFLWHVPSMPPGADDALIFHAEHAADSLIIDVHAQKKEEHVLLAGEESIAEDLRLCYVALTRARHRCVLTWGNIKQTDDSPLSYLLANTPLPRNRPDKKPKIDNDVLNATLDTNLKKLVAACPEHITLEAANLDMPATYQANTDVSLTLSARRRQRRLPPGLRITSFSRLIARDAHLGREAEDGYDHDAAAVVEPVDVHVEDKERIRLADVNATGAEVGLLVHDVLEHSDFGADARDTVHASVKQLAPQHGVDADDAALIGVALAETLDTPLGDGDLAFCLSDVTQEQRLAEMEFIFPVTARLTAAAVAKAIERDCPSLVPTSYLKQLHALGFTTLSGFLRGYIDLCLEHDGRYYVIDYKTNHLGPHINDYTNERMQLAMGQHHYYLQAIVYSVALHRHLQLRLPNYAYDVHFGGFLYLFVRGMAPTHPLGLGVLHGRPSRALVESLSALIGDVPR